VNDTVCLCTLSSLFFPWKLIDRRVTQACCAGAFLLNLSLHAFSALTLFVGRQEGHPACKNWVVDAGVVVCLGQGGDMHMAQLILLPLTISCCSKSRLVLPSLFYVFGAYLPGLSRTRSNRAIKQLCVCVCVFVVCRLWLHALTRHTQLAQLPWLRPSTRVRYDQTQSIMSCHLISSHRNVPVTLIAAMVVGVS